jgi:hypothetical protein
LATSTCIGSRLTNNGTTVTDNLSGLVWEKKTNDASVHDEGNTYSWSTGSPYDGNGTAFTSLLTGAVTGLNVAGFAGANDWRMPTLVELQTAVLDFPCTGAFGGPTCSCGASPCIDATFGPTQSDRYWSATTYVSSPDGAWIVGFDVGYVDYYLKAFNFSVPYVRAVAGGL